MGSRSVALVKRDGHHPGLVGDAGAAHVPAAVLCTTPGLVHRAAEVTLPGNTSPGAEHQSNGPSHRGVPWRPGL